MIPRNETEWVELVEMGFAKLVGNNKNKIIEKVNQLFNSIETLNDLLNVYGEGDASQKIVDLITQFN